MLIESLAESAPLHGVHASAHVGGVRVARQQCIQTTYRPLCRERHRLADGSCLKHRPGRQVAPIDQGTIVDHLSLHPCPKLQPAPGCDADSNDLTIHPPASINHRIGKNALVTCPCLPTPNRKPARGGLPGAAQAIGDRLNVRHVLRMRQPASGVQCLMADLAGWITASIMWITPLREAISAPTRLAPSMVRRPSSLAMWVD